MHNFILKYSQLPFAYLVFLIAAYLVPPVKKLKRYRNILLILSDMAGKRANVRSLPAMQRIAPTAICNYRCSFCEIHKDNILYPNRAKNNIGLPQVQNYEGFVSNAYSLSFFGGSEEPFLSRGMGDVVAYLKTNFGTKLMVNTNASMMKGKLLETLVEHKFDYILVSYHAGTDEGYRALMTGKVDKVDNNLQALADAKKRRNQSLPKVAFNFALQRLNADEYVPIIDKAKKLNVDEVLVNRYYGGRNKLQDSKVSFEFDIETGNKTLDQIYAYGQEQNMRILPEKTEYWEQSNEDIHWNQEDFDADIRCAQPWTGLHFNPDLKNANSHLVGVCNRAELFRVRYNELDLSTDEKAKILWNHSLLQFLRQTVNSKDNINPLCKYCKNRNMKSLRNVDTKQYSEVRDQAVVEFFEEYRKFCVQEDVKGLEVMTNNPYSERQLQDKLAILAAQETDKKQQLDEAIL